MFHKTVIFTLYDDFEPNFIVNNAFVTEHNIADTLYRISLYYIILLTTTQMCTRHVYKLSFSPLFYNRQNFYSVYIKVPI
jgi:hypothetical protein